MPQEMQIGGVEFTARAATDGYIVLGICLGMPAILSIIVMIARPQLFFEWLPALAVGLAAVALTFAWLSAFRLQVADGVLVYRTLFSGESRIRLTDISAVQRVLEFNPWKHWMKPRNRLEIYMGSPRTAPQLYINLKVFRKQDVERLLQHLEPKVRKR